MTKKLTPIQREYRKQVNRLNRLTKSMQSRGFFFESPLYTEKRPTRKAINELKYITASRAYAKASYILPTGEIISGTKARQFRRDVAKAEKATSEEEYLEQLGRLFGRYGVVEQDVLPERRLFDYKIVDHKDTGFTEQQMQEGFVAEFMEEVNTFFPPELADKIKDALDRAISKTSKQMVGVALNNIPYDVLYYLTVYGDSDQAIMQWSSEITKYMPISDKDKRQLEKEFDTL